MPAALLQMRPSTETHCGDGAANVSRYSAMQLTHCCHSWAQGAAMARMLTCSVTASPGRHTTSQRRCGPTRLNGARVPRASSSPCESKDEDSTWRLPGSNGNAGCLERATMPTWPEQTRSKPNGSTATILSVRVCARAHGGVPGCLLGHQHRFSMHHALRVESEFGRTATLQRTDAVGQIYARTGTAQT
jgi:hypothetical protein